jgi:Tfp pilus assembly protein PilN
MRAVNLIPSEQRQGAGSLTGRSGGGALIVLGVVAALAVLVLLYGRASHQISSQKGQVASLTAQAGAIQARTGRLAPYTSFVTMANQRTRTVAQLVQARFDWSHALHELGRVMPAGTALGALHGVVGPAGATGSSSSTSGSGGTGVGGSPSSSTPAGSVPVFTLTGCATSQAVVAQALQRLKLMDGAGEVKLQSSTQSGAGSSSSASAGEGCAGASFSAQIVFQGLPAGPAPSVSTGSSAATAAAHSGGSKVQVSTRAKAAKR